VTNQRAPSFKTSPEKETFWWISLKDSAKEERERERKKKKKIIIRREN